MGGHRHVALRFESKLILYALVVLMLPLALAAFLVHENIAAAKRETMGTALASARGIAGSVDAFLARHDQTLVALSRAPAISSPDRLVAERVLARAIRQQTSFRWIALAGSDGVMRTYAAGHSSLPGMMNRVAVVLASRSTTSILIRPARSAAGAPSTPSMILAQAPSAPRSASITNSVSSH